MPKRIILYILLLMGLTGCKKHFDSVNTDPDATGPEQYAPENLLSAAQLTYTGSARGGGDAAHVELGGCAAFIQHLAALDTYEFYGDKYFSSTNTGDYFESAYGEQVKMATDLVALTEGNPQHNNLHQMGRIMRAMIMERITDIYGDVPYFEAGRGYYDKVYYPGYDAQQAIYADLLKEVSEATAALDPAGDKPATDLFFHDRGDQVAAWQRFGNTLLLRMAMRLTKRDPATARQYVRQTSGHTMQSNADNAIVMHDEAGQGLTQNRVSLDFLQVSIRTKAKLSKTFVDFMKDNDDPRLPVLSEVRINGHHNASEQQGLPNGYNTDRLSPYGIYNRPDFPDTVDAYSQPSALVVKLDAPTFVLTYAESEFLLADAAARWGIGNAESHYHNGVVAAIRELAAYGAAGVIEEAVAEAYYNAHPYNAAKGLEMINTQFWAATLFNEYEAWCNWRRTGLPALVPVNYLGNITNGTIPRRLPYPLSEASSNAANYKAAQTAIPGGDKMTSRMWWDE